MQTIHTHSGVYVHRNGRTARWDGTGNAYLLVGPQERMPEFAVADSQPYHLPQRVPAPAKPLWATIYIGKGKKDKISRGDVAGFLSKVGGLEGRFIETRYFLCF